MSLTSEPRRSSGFTQVTWCGNISTPGSCLISERVLIQPFPHLFTFLGRWSRVFQMYMGLPGAYGELLLSGNLLLWTAGTRVSLYRTSFSFAQRERKTTMWHILFSAEFLSKCLSCVVDGPRLHWRQFSSNFRLWLIFTVFFSFGTRQSLIMSQCKEKQRLTKTFIVAVGWTEVLNSLKSSILHSLKACQFVQYRV